nr:hypothetical protein B0A51_07770 [Rachicladosporium sp. CCFEE 5018]
MPHLGATMDDRQQAFQILKPACVALSRTALALSGPKGSVADLTQDLESLRTILNSFTARSSPLDEKLADYVFFPLSQFLKQSQKLSLTCLEITLEVLAVLIEHGWRQHIQHALAAQMLILCTLLAGEKPTGLSTEKTTNELRTTALRCLCFLFRALAGTHEGRRSVTAESAVPQLGQTISTTLDALVDGAGLELQVAAAKVLHALVDTVDDGNVLASFLPGVVSKLTRVLAPQTKQRRNHAVLIECLDIMSVLLKAVLGNPSPTSSAHNTSASVNGSVAENESKSENRDGHQTEASPHVLSALQQICRLRGHDREDVRAALGDLCVTVLKNCSISLATSRALALGTLVVLSTDSPRVWPVVELENMLQTDTGLLALLQELLHDQLQSLVQTMMGADEHLKTQKIQHLRAAYGMLNRCGAITTLLMRAIAKALDDSVVIVLQSSTLKSSQTISIEPMQSLDLAIQDSDSMRTSFGSALVLQRGQEPVMASIESFIELLGQSPASTHYSIDVAGKIRMSHGDAQVSQFWTAYSMVKAAMSNDQVTNTMLTTYETDSANSIDLLEELYSFSLDALTSSVTATAQDQMVQELALRTVALRAQAAGLDFRAELVDALYPILHTLASPTPALQQDSIVALNIVTAACGYPSTSALIIENVDYLTNAVALKLNTFDVSPQAPQVLLMMLRLAGPGLLPYMEDTVEGIFAALESYHGYATLVELLFMVLGVMAEEGIKAPAFASPNKGLLENVYVKEEQRQPMAMAKLVSTLRDRAAERESLESAENDERGHQAFPREPWAADPTTEKEDDDSAPPPHDTDVEVPPPAPKIYALLLKITTLTQHFLPSASPSLRTSLLSLIRTSIPAIALHDNSFLPLINTLWPEIVSRLDDEEVHVRTAALEVIALLCEHAGSFMRSRITALWPVIKDLHRRLVADLVKTVAPVPKSWARENVETDPKAVSRAFALTKPSGSSAVAVYADTSLRLLWDALVGFLLAMVRSTPSLDPDVFDETLEMLTPVLDRAEVREALEGPSGNADAVWLIRLRTGAMMPPTMPRATAIEGAGWHWAEVH